MRRTAHRLLATLLVILWGAVGVHAQINVQRILMMGRNALYYEDYVLSIQRFNLVIGAKPHLPEPYFLRGLAKFYLEDHAGAEADCTNAITRNPYSEQYYELRALCRINLERFAEAEADYRKLLDINPRSTNAWHNRVLCLVRQDSFARADSCLDIMLRQWPKQSSNYAMKAQVQLSLKDTTKAEEWTDRALEMNAFDASALNIKSMLLLRRGDHKAGEEMLDRAIVQTPRNADLYINRALARYHQDNLRGAMTDYDAAIEINRGSFAAHYNRGLLRAQVGDDNRAIEDFNFVIEQQPDNYMALYNRAMLRSNVGDYRGAMQDISTIIQAYPQFWDGYLFRAQLRRRLGDVYGAERDEFKVTKARIEGVSKKTAKSKTRKKDDKNLENYDRLVENDDVPTEQYANAYRGKVQDHTTALQPLPPYLLSYFPRQNALSHYFPYLAEVEQLNSSRALFSKLHVSLAETAASEKQIAALFDEIAQLQGENNGNYRSDLSVEQLLRLALAHYHVRDFESAIEDVNVLLSQHPGHHLALMLRAQMYYAMLMAEHPELSNQESVPLSPSTEVRLVLNQAADDLVLLIRKNATNAYAHYNLGNMHFLLHDYDLAEKDYTQAISIDASFPEAYFNRGVARILQNRIPEALADLSQAGEYGIYSAYNLIKKYTKK
ncbi:MAG: tetratricopeptide repeat protein [Bacteroidales bacterium]|nr:tetratricopeptide repeat protein [Candidatus Physcousia equi]